MRPGRRCARWPANAVGPESVREWTDGSTSSVLPDGHEHRTSAGARSLPQAAPVFGSPRIVSDRYAVRGRILAVPVRSLSEAKTRLSPALDRMERAALTPAMPEDGLDGTLQLLGWPSGG